MGWSHHGLNFLHPPESDLHGPDTPGPIREPGIPPPEVAIRQTGMESWQDAGCRASKWR